MKHRRPATIGGWLRWVLNPRPAVGPGTRKVAGLLATRDYDGACAVFERLSSLCDAVIVLDDNSSQPFPHAGGCLEYLRLQNGGPWNASANLTLLLYRAYVHGFEWVVTLDDDLLMPADFQTRADVTRVIDGMAATGLDIVHFKLRDLWDGLERYRDDGRWAEKTFPVVRRNWFFYEGITLESPLRRLHSGAFPVSLRARWTLDASKAVYHTGCLDAGRRRDRVEKYRREDPANEFQADYGYILDETGILLKPVPEADRAALAAAYRPSAEFRR